MEETDLSLAERQLLSTVAAGTPLVQRTLADGTSMVVLRAQPRGIVLPSTEYERITDFFSIGEPVTVGEIEEREWTLTAEAREHFEAGRFSPEGSELGDSDFEGPALEDDGDDDLAYLDGLHSGVDEGAIAAALRAAEEQVKAEASKEIANAMPPVPLEKADDFPKMKTTGPGMLEPDPARRRRTTKPKKSKDPVLAQLQADIAEPTRFTELEFVSPQGYFPIESSEPSDIELIASLSPRVEVRPVHFVVRRPSVPFDSASIRDQRGKLIKQPPGTLVIQPTFQIGDKKFSLHPNEPAMILDVLAVPEAWRSEVRQLPDDPSTKGIVLPLDVTFYSMDHPYTEPAILLETSVGPRRVNPGDRLVFTQCALRSMNKVFNIDAQGKREEATTEIMRQFGLWERPARYSQQQRPGMSPARQAQQHEQAREPDVPVPHSSEAPSLGSWTAADDHAVREFRESLGRP